jgi:predicted nuclease of predicted toxin-antitoxin system
MNSSVTFFIDRCLGSKRIAEALRSAGITVEIHSDYFDQGAPDVDWLPEVGRRGWIVLTKDANIGKRTLEKIAVAQSHIKMFTLASQNLSGDDMVAIFRKAIVPMQEFARKNSAPFIAKIYRDGRIDLWKDHQALLEELQQFQALNEADSEN